MAEALDTNMMDCPVCLEWLTEPKILPCGHHMCKKCVLTTLETADKLVGCPSCHQPILPTQEKSSTDVNTFVDSLPTNHVTWMIIKSHQVLRGDAVCGICDEDSEAVSFCFECDTKMCKICSKYHSKMPYSSNHNTAELNTLTAKKLAIKKSMPCNIHPEYCVQNFCSAHNELVCLNCAWLNHKNCSIDGIETSAVTQRKDLRRQCEKLKQREIALSKEIENLDKRIIEAEAKFALRREEVISTYVDLIKHIETEKHNFLDNIEEEERVFMDETLSNRDKLVALHAAIVAHTASITEMISDSPDVALLETLAQLKSRLDDLETKKPGINLAMVKEVYFDVKLVDKLKELSGHLGELRTAPQEVRTAPQEEKTADLVRCTLCETVTEDTIKFEVQEGDLRGHRGFGFLSNTHYIRNCRWQIQLKPWNGTEAAHLGFLLYCSLPYGLKLMFVVGDEEDRMINGPADYIEPCQDHGSSCVEILVNNVYCHWMTACWSCKVKYELRILNTLPQRKPLQEEFEHTFGNGYGNDQFITMDELMDPANGYMKDGKVTFEAHVVPEEPELNVADREETVDIVRCILCGTVTEGTIQFEVQEEDLREVKGGVLQSKFHLTRSIVWRIQLKPWNGTEAAHLGFLLECSLPYGLLSCKVKYELRILNTLPQRKPLQEEFEHKFDDEDEDEEYGNDQFITMAELLDPANGYIKDGKVTFEAHVVPEEPEHTQ